MSFALNPYNRSRLPPRAAGRRARRRAAAGAERRRGARRLPPMMHYPEYFKIDGAWLLAEDSRMDCVPVCEDGRIFVREFRHIRAGDAIVCGAPSRESRASTSNTTGFDPAPDGEGELARRGAPRRQLLPSAWALARDGVLPASTTSSTSRLKHEREHGYVVWVMGPAFSSTASRARRSPRSSMRGYVDAVFAGNALATHDLEGSYFHTALGQDIETQENRPHATTPPGHHQPRAAVRLHRPVSSRGAGVGRHHARAGEEGRALRAGRLHPRRRPASRACWQRLRCAGRHALPPAQSHHGRVHGHHAAHHRHGQHDAIVPRARGRHRAPGVLLLVVDIAEFRGEQAHRPRLIWPRAAS